MDGTLGRFVDLHAEPLEAIQGIIIVDDKQVVEVTGEKLSNDALKLTQVKVAQHGP